MNDHSFLHQDPDVLDNSSSNPSKTETLGDLIAKRYSRRCFVNKTTKGALAVSVGVSLSSFLGCSDQSQGQKETAERSVKTGATAGDSSFNFEEIQHGQGSEHLVAPDHEAQVLIRWGDPIFNDSPDFDPYAQSASKQEQQFGFNNDFIGYWPLEEKRAKNGEKQERALLCINHEYPKTNMMFTGMRDDFWADITAEQVEIEKAAVGCSIIEIEKTGETWQLNRSSPYNRRISARSTEFKMSGPAAGHKRLKTNADPTGTKVIGTINNCAGGMTPWGTYLSCEENINYHFLGRLDIDHPEAGHYLRYGIPAGYFLWGKFDPRFNLSEEPNEPNRFGWVVEIDPLDPYSTPKKRTALGRFKHEGAENVIAPDGRLVIYMGDDQRFDYLYKFITRDKVDLDRPSANKDLLDDGTLYVAQFTEQGDVLWMALEYGTGPLNASNGFNSQADVLIETRRAADLLKATPMDRPEDVVPNAKTGNVYVMLTNNTKRTADQPNIANPRGPNTFGHIIEISEPNNDFGSTRSKWDFLIKAGDPGKPEIEAQWHRETSSNGWFASPDNGVIDPDNRLWVSTDQGDKSSLSGTNDGLWALETEGELRGKGKMFFRCPDGAELCGPVFSNTGESLFVAVQHPGEDDAVNIHFDNPLTRWPDFQESMPPRPSIVVIQRKGGGKIG